MTTPRAMVNRFMQLASAPGLAPAGRRSHQSAVSFGHGRQAPEGSSRYRGHVPSRGSAVSTAGPRLPQLNRLDAVPFASRLPIPFAWSPLHVSSAVRMHAVTSANHPSTSPFSRGAGRAARPRRCQQRSASCSPWRRSQRRAPRTDLRASFIGIWSIVHH